MTAFCYLEIINDKYILLNEDLLPCLVFMCEHSVQIVLWPDDDLLVDMVVFLQIKFYVKSEPLSVMNNKGLKLLQRNLFFHTPTP